MSNIVVIEDDVLITELVVKILQGAGHQVTAARNGKLGFALVKSHPPAVVITDLVMPDHEGLEAIQQLRSGYPEIPIIAISGALNAPGYLNMAAKLGARHTLLKPFEPAVLLEAVNDVLGLAPS